jgi:hypothetical protein
MGFVAPLNRLLFVYSKTVRSFGGDKNKPCNARLYPFSGVRRQIVDQLNEFFKRLEPGKQLMAINYN